MQSKVEKGFFGFAPIWVEDLHGECIVHPRGIGYILLPIAELMFQSINMFLSFIDPLHEPHFIIYTETRDDDAS